MRRIQETTGTVIEIEEDGTVMIASTNAEWANAALAQVEALTATVQIGKIYTGKVTSIKDFGAFVEILPGRDGLCHISELSNGFVNSVADVCQVGDEMKVLVIDVDEHDRVKLSRRRAWNNSASRKNRSLGGEERLGAGPATATETAVVTAAVIATPAGRIARPEVSVRPLTVPVRRLTSRTPPWDGSAIRPTARIGD